jgi:hypothetical protein
MYTCPTSSSSFTGINKISDCICDKGFIGSNGGPCQLCTADKYCPGGTNSFECAMFSSSPPGGDAETDCICVGGYQGDAGGPCTLCPANVYCDSGNLTPCPMHTVSSYGSDELADCSCKAGYYGANGSVCLICPIDRFCTGGDSSLNCPQNSETLVGSTTSTDCTCVSGWYGPDGGECVECEPGSWCHAGVKTQCPANSTTGIGAAVLTECVCVPGFKGMDGGMCSVCTAGTWCLEGVVSHCSVNSNAPTQSSNVTACICDTGYNGEDGGICIACGAGTYKNQVGNISCTACDVSTYSSVSSATSVDICINCPINSFSVPGSTSPMDCTCKTGHAGTNWSDCSPCDAGTYKSVLGPGSCTSCGVDTYSTTKAATSPNECINCPLTTVSANGSDELADCMCTPGQTAVKYTGSSIFYCTACVAGTYKTTTGTGACTYCEVGTYATITAAISSETCLVCPDDNKHSEPGSNKSTDCTTLPIPTVPSYVTPKATVTFTASLSMHISEFTPSKRNLYVAGVADALRISESVVKITSITEQMMRRRLLTSVTNATTTTVVETSVIVRYASLESVDSYTTSENLNRVLRTTGISVEDVSEGITVVESGQWIIITSAVVGGMLVVTFSVAAVLACYWRCAKDADMQMTYP